jgi:thioredoxin reductase (NADPH)
MGVRPAALGRGGRKGGDVGRPIFFLVNDRERALRELAGALDRRFGADYQILSEQSPDKALIALARLAATSETVALLIGTPRMAGSDGVEFLVRAHQLHPGAKRVLLIGRGQWAAASAHPAVRAMLLGQIDSYLFDPVGEVERWLYLPVCELLAEWAASQPPQFEAVRIVGLAGEERAHALRDYFARAAIPYRFHAADTEAGQALLAEAGQDGSRLPVLVFYTGRVLVDPSNAELAEHLGWRRRPPPGTYDVAVVGGGPAGLAAAVYAASEGLQTLVLESEWAGGQAGTSSLIRNYLGFPRGLSGDNFTNRALEQAWLFGANFVSQQVTGLGIRGPGRFLQVLDGSEIAARTVIIATGVAWRRLHAPGLEALHGAGVYYGAAGTEAPAMEGGDVFVVGAGNSAGQAAVHLARYARSVTLLVRGDALASSMSDYLVRELGAIPNVAVRLRAEVVGGEGRGRLERITLRDRQDGVARTVPAAGLFIMIGGEPRTDWLAGSVQRDRQGYVLTGRDLVRDGALPAGWPLERAPSLMETSEPGVFAVGDVRAGSVKRVASAAGAGAIAVQLVHEYLNEERA